MTTQTMTSKTLIATARPANLLKRLCHHFSLKVTASHDADQGHVQFAMGTCAMHVTDEGLLIEVIAADADALGAVQRIVGEHVKLFGQREGLTVDWQPTALR